MNSDGDADHNLPDLPDKLSERIDGLPRHLDGGDRIIGNGETELTSEHPVSVVEYFLSANVDEWADWTFKDYSYDLTRFLEYCEYANIEDLSELSSRDLVGFKQWRKKDGNIGLATLHGQLANIRVLIRWCEQIEIVEKGIADEIEMPDLDPSDVVSHTRITSEQAQQIFDYYEQFNYVSREFTEFALMWGVLCRLGGVRSIDLEDYNREEGYIELNHRPDEDTPLKNGESEVEGEGGERKINLPDWLCEILNRYIDGTEDPAHPKRIEVKDEYGRKPLFTTKYGRVSESTLRRDLYRVTQPCRYGRDCPHDMDPEECDAKTNNNLLSRCLSAVSPHPVRRGGICHQLKQGVPKDTICERADVSRKVLNKHYDLRTKEEARQQRRAELRKHLEGYEEPNHDRPTGVENQLPLLTDIAAAQSKVNVALNDVSRAQARKGLAGYSLFVALVGFNFGLMGIGFDPIAWELVWDL